MYYLVQKEYLGLIGGNSVEKNARNILKRVFAKPIRQEINFTGKSGKVAFKNLQIYECLKGMHVLIITVKHSVLFNLHDLTF